MRREAIKDLKGQMAEFDREIDQLFESLASMRMALHGGHVGLDDYRGGNKYRKTRYRHEHPRREESQSIYGRLRSVCSRADKHEMDSKQLEWRIRKAEHDNEIAGKTIEGFFPFSIPTGLKRKPNELCKGPSANARS